MEGSLFFCVWCCILLTMQLSLFFLYCECGRKRFMFCMIIQAVVLVLCLAHCVHVINCIIFTFLCNPAVAKDHLIPMFDSRDQCCTTAVFCFLFYRDLKIKMEFHWHGFNIISLVCSSIVRLFLPDSSSVIFHCSIWVFKQMKTPRKC